MRDTAFKLPVAHTRTWFSSLPPIDVLMLAEGYERRHKDEEKFTYINEVVKLAELGWTVEEYLAEFCQRLEASHTLFMMKLAAKPEEPNIDPQTLDDAYYVECVEKGM